MFFGELTTKECRQKLVTLAHELGKAPPTITTQPTELPKELLAVNIASDQAAEQTVSSSPAASSAPGPEPLQTGPAELPATAKPKAVKPSKLRKPSRLMQPKKVRLVISKRLSDG